MIRGKDLALNEAAKSGTNITVNSALPAIDDAVYVKHGHNLEDKSLPQMTRCVKVTH